MSISIFFTKLYLHNGVVEGGMGQVQVHMEQAHMETEVAHKG